MATLPFIWNFVEVKMFFLEVQLGLCHTHTGDRRRHSGKQGRQDQSCCPVPPASRSC